MTTPKTKRSLAGLGGTITAHGDPGFAELLTEAWGAAAEDPDRLTHGFHAYPARMHPGMAACLISGLTDPGDTVIDPFCGGGTVLLEAMVAGRRAYGIDLNPVAVRLARVRCQRRDTDDRDRFTGRLTSVVEASLQRVAERVKSRAPLSPVERRYYASHVLLELAGLYEEIGKVEPPADRHALQMILSSIVVKFSQQRSDTNEQMAGKQIGKRIPTRFFGRKGEELLAGWADVDAACAVTPGGRTFRVRVVEDDARNAARVLPQRARARAVISSPPYGGTYDYVEHHALRYPWLGESPKRMRSDELGARRNLSDPGGATALERWDREVREMLAAMASILGPGGIIALVMGDAEIGKKRVDVDRQLDQLAPKLGLRLIASAEQPRVDWRGGPPRREHILLLRPAVEA